MLPREDLERLPDVLGVLADPDPEQARDDLVAPEHLSTLVQAADANGIDCIHTVRLTLAPDWPHWRERLMRRGSGGLCRRYLPRRKSGG